MSNKNKRARGFLVRRQRAKDSSSGESRSPGCINQVTVSSVCRVTVTSSVSVSLAQQRASLGGGAKRDAAPRDAVPVIMTTNHKTHGRMSEVRVRDASYSVASWNRSPSTAHCILDLIHSRTAEPPNHRTHSGCHR